MGRNFILKFVEEEVWEQTPIDIQKKKIRFGVLQYWIRIRKKRIERLKMKIKELSSERIEWEKERTMLYHELYEFQNDYIPSVSPTCQKGNSFQWSINLTIGNIKRKVYLGSNKKVRERLDEINNIEKFLPKYNKNIRGGDLIDECRDEIRKIIQKNLINELEKDFKGVNEKWENNQLKMWDFFY